MFVYVTHVRSHVTHTYIRHIAARISARDEEGFPLVSLAGNVEGDWP